MSILQMSISAGLLIIAIIIIRAVALNKLPKTMFLALWVIALCRLLVPISIPSQFSVYSIVSKIFNWVTPNITAITGIEKVLPMSSPAGVTGQIEPLLQEIVFSIAPTTIIWLAGMLAVFIFFSVVYYKNHRELCCALPIRDNKYLDEWLTKHRLLRPVTIMQSDRITTPVAVGMVKPRIILPKSMNMDDKQLLRYVLMHEYYHIKRFDVLWKLLLIFALCIHWFNPLMWVMFVLVNRDLELTCDEMVIQHFGAETKTAYAYSLICMAEQRSKLTPLYNGFCKNAAEERIVSIMKIRKMSLVTFCVSVALIAVLATAFTTTATALSYDEAASEVATADTLISNKEFQSYEQAKEDWKQFGVTYNSITNRLYYNGEKVQFFVDNRSCDPAHFNGTVYDMDDGSHYLVTRRDETGKLIGIDEITETEAAQVAHWRR